MIQVPRDARFLIDTLEAHGFEAYAVGGCVRDSLLGVAPHDWDICTSALPEQTRSCFAGRPVIDTGIRHGTVTILLDHKPFEVTTYRVDGDYSDGRHPDQVEFVRSLREDLARRDFTVNAMAYSPARGLVDYFGGREDLGRGVIRCVGDAAQRFSEDALRILRALRFASTYAFTIEEGTARAALAARGLLQRIAAERIQIELGRLLCGGGVAEMLLQFRPVFEEFLPEVGAMAGFAQENPHHCYDVWEHTARSVAAAPPDRVLRYTMLLHDFGKPAAFTRDEQGVGHFHAHAQAGAEMARAALHRLKCDGATLSAVVELVRYHDTQIPAEPRAIRRWLGRLGEAQLSRLFAVRRADIQAQSAYRRQEKLDAVARAEAVMEEVLRQRQCFSLKGLAVDGRDLIAAGVPEGKRVGLLLRALLEQVVEGTLPNEREALLAECARLQK